MSENALVTGSSAAVAVSMFETCARRFKNFAAEISIESIWRNGNGKHANGNVVLIYLLSNGVSRARLISAESIFSCGFLNSVLSQSARARVCAKYDRDK